jgi:hypothetical protein
MNLTHNQQAAAVKMIEGLTNKVAIMKAGLRGGANNVVAEVVNQTNYKEICVFGLDYKSAMHFGNEWDRRTGMQYQRWPETHSGEDVLIVIADAFNIPHSFGTYLLARQRKHHVIVFGSNGPEYQRPHDWRFEISRLPTNCIQSYNAWDLNEFVKEAELRVKFGADLRFERDYCAF